MSDLLSPGIAYGCFELLDILDEAPLPMSLETANGLQRLGVVAAHRVTRYAVALGWIEVSEKGELVPTERGRLVKALPLTEQRLRRAVLDIVEATNPPWVQNARFGRRRFLQYAPAEIVQVCEEAGLTEALDRDVIMFWDALSARARGLHDVQLNAIGREGEELSIAYEAVRTGATPKWIALESNEDGYDLLSRISKEDARRLCIEVKASRQGMRGHFYITRHEWDTALALVNYQMHLWDISRTSPSVAILQDIDISPHLPLDNGEGAWDIARIPFSAFEGRFCVQVIEAR